LDGTLKVVHRWINRTPARRPQNGHPAMNGTPLAADVRLDVRVDRSGVTWTKNGDGHGDHSERVPTTAGARPPAAVRQQFHGMHVDRAAERIEAWMLQWLVERAGLPPADVQRDKPFAEFGVDSLTAVELSQELEDEFGVELNPIVAWNHPTPAALSRYLAEKVTGTQQTVASEFNGVPPAAELDDLLAAVENLSDEEAARMLAEEE
jgi:acyl carrier protein